MGSGEDAASRLGPPMDLEGGASPERSLIRLYDAVGIC